MLVFDKSVGFIFFQKSRAYKTCASCRRFFRGPYGVHPVLKMPVVVVFFTGGGGVGILSSSFFRGGHSVIVCFVVAYSWTQIPVVTGVIPYPQPRAGMQALITLL